MNTKPPSTDLEKNIKDASQKLEQARNEMHKVVIGQEALVDRLLGALLVRGHILLEGVPGLAKTTAVLALSRLCHLDFKRIQFTPDLLPSDVTGNEVFNPKDQTFSVRKGPIFSHLLLADEINRAPAKVQSALLEAMQERRVTVGDQTFNLPKIFLVLATQNPIEQEGTFPLPEAQVDRFLFKVVLDYPTKPQEQNIVQQFESQNFADIKPLFTEKNILALQSLVDQIYIDEVTIQYITDLVDATRNPDNYGLDSQKDFIAFGASPRGSINLMRAAKVEALFAGRAFVTPQDVKNVAYDVLRHRIIPSFEAEAEQISTEGLIEKVLEAVPVP